MRVSRFPPYLLCAVALAAPLRSQMPSGDTRPVRVWLDAAAPLVPGAPVRVYVQTAVDGNLLVLLRRTDGSVSVLYPSDPRGDPSARAGTYEIRGSSGREAFTVSGPPGTGMVVAALSSDTVWFDEFTHGREWDAVALAHGGSGGGPEAVLTDVVQRMVGDGSFNYDVATYTVVPPVLALGDTMGAAPQGACVGCSFTEVVIGAPLAFGFERSHHRGHSLQRPVAAPPDPPALALHIATKPAAPAPIEPRQRTFDRTSALVRSRSIERLAARLPRVPSVAPTPNPEPRAPSSALAVVPRTFEPRARAAAVPMTVVATVPRSAPAAPVSVPVRRAEPRTTARTLAVPRAVWRRP